MKPITKWAFWSQDEILCSPRLLREVVCAKENESVTTSQVRPIGADTLGSSDKTGVFDMSEFDDRTHVVGKQHNGGGKEGESSWSTSLERSVMAHAATGRFLDLLGGYTPANDQPPVELAVMQGWGAEQTIRSEVLRHLIVTTQWPAHAKGVRLRGLRIIGALDLESATLRCPLVLDDCYLDSPDPVTLDYANVSRLELVRCRMAGLSAEMLVATKELDLTQSVFAGTVRLLGANIAGQLCCNGAVMTATSGSDEALIADGATIDGAVFLNGLKATGAVRLLGANITGQLSCRGATITANPNGGDALIADRVTVGGDVFLDNGFTASGAVRLLGANVTGQLSCRNATITANSNGGDAFIADGVTVGDAVFLDSGFTATGTVCLPGAHITGQLSCRGATLNASGNDTDTLIADRITVGGDVFLETGFTSTGAVRLSGAKIGGGLSVRGAKLAGKEALIAEGTDINQALVWAPKTPVHGLVSLERAHIRRLDDDWSKDGAYWPGPGNLRLNGLMYDGFGGDYHATWQQRLDWIRSQHQAARPDEPGRFDAQPYDHLAQVYRRAGREADARRIAIARHSDVRTFGNLGPLRHMGNWLLDVTVKHGYMPTRAVLLLAATFVFALTVFTGAQLQDDLMVPTGTLTRFDPMPSASECTRTYPCFSPVGYAVDISIPFASTGQADNWRPDASAHSGWAYVASTWVFKGFGWVFAVLAIAGYTGILRKD